jgi:hypothetical protein
MEDTAVVDAGVAALAAAGAAALPPPMSIRIYLSLYKVQANIYLLDFQKTDGNPFDFMTLCARIITELKALSQVTTPSLRSLNY